MGLVSLLFSFRGRINRQQYWFGTGGVSFAGGLLNFSMMMMSVPLPGMKGEHPSPVGALLVFPIMLVMAWSSLAIQVKRFHDRNQPGWLAALPMVPVIGIVQAVAGGIFAEHSPAQIGADLMPPLGLLLLISFGFFINLGCLGGTDGPNKYGDPPRWWGGGAPSPSPQSPMPKTSTMPDFLSASSLGGAASAIDRAIAEAPRGLQPATATATAHAPAPSMARAASPASSGFGRAPASGGGFGKKR